LLSFLAEMKCRFVVEFKKSVQTKALLCLLIGLSLSGRAADAEAEALKSNAYRLYEQKHYVEAADSFQRYLQRNPADAKAAVDCAALLSQLNRHDQAAKVLEDLHQTIPRNEPAYFKLAVEFVSLGRFADAEKVFTELEKSANRDLASAA